MLSNTAKCSVVKTSTSTKGWYERKNENGDLKTTSTGAPKKQDSEDEKRKEEAAAALCQKVPNAVVENDTTTKGQGSSRSSATLSRHAAILLMSRYSTCTSSLPAATSRRCRSPAAFPVVESSAAVLVRWAI